MRRVLPRDAFNDANLLKCIGQLTLLIEDDCPTVRGLSYHYDGEPFNIQQDESDGSTYVTNVQFWANKKPVRMVRPMNSREPWPLMMWLGDSDYYVFGEAGNVLPAFNVL